MVIGDRPFLSVPNNLCLALNVDWFNPYKEMNYSVGAILNVLNLPQSERFKEQNVILVGMIPGPKEPYEHLSLPISSEDDEFGFTFHSLTH